MDEQENMDTPLEQNTDIQKEWKKRLCTVTPLSKYLALILFILLPFLGLYVGFQFGEAKALRSVDFSSAPVMNEEERVFEEKPINVIDSERERGILFAVRSEGGLCQNGPCWNELVLFTDSSWQYTDSEGGLDEGEIDPAVNRNLIQGVANADFDTIRSVPFEGTCPSAFDGQEQTYTFHTELGKQVIHSCQTDITESDFFNEQISWFIFHVHSVRAN